MNTKQITRVFASAKSLAVLYFEERGENNCFVSQYEEGFVHAQAGYSGGKQGARIAWARLQEVLHQLGFRNIDTYHGQAAVDTFKAFFED